MQWSSKDKELTIASQISIMFIINFDISCISTHRL